MRMNLTGYIFREDIVDKLAWKHQIQPEEVVEVFENKPHVEQLERGHRLGENLYVALGQTYAGRYLTVFFIHKKGGEALINTARNMVKNKTPKAPLPETFKTFEEMADFWDTHDVTDYEEYLTPVEVNVSTHPKHNYVITLSDTLDTALRQVQQKEGVSLNTLINLWVQEKLQQYTVVVTGN